MNCRDFQRGWDALLDAEATAGSSIEVAEARLVAHADGCPACRSILARYHALRQAIRVWRHPPAPPPDLVHRILSVPAEITPSSGRSAADRVRTLWATPRGRIRLLAACFLIMLLPTPWLVRSDRRPREGRPGDVAPTGVRDLHSVAAPGPALDRALAEATSATMALARSASGPAARVGRELLVATEPTNDPSLVPTSLDPLGAGTAEASAVIQRVGDHLSAGVRPLSSTARHAFGFLLGTPPPRAGTPPGRSNFHGARSG